MNQPREIPVLLPVADWRHSAYLVCRSIRETGDAVFPFQQVTAALVMSSPGEEREAYRHDFELVWRPGFWLAGQTEDPKVTFDKLDRMWKGCEWHLSMYAMMLLDQIEHESDTHKVSFSSGIWERNLVNAQLNFSGATKTAEPWWFGEASFHESHQAWLKRKLPEVYRHQFSTPIALPLVWPPHQPDERVL